MNDLDFALSLDRMKDVNLTEELLWFATYQDHLHINHAIGVSENEIEYRMQLMGKYKSRLSYIRLVPVFQQENVTISHRFAISQEKSQILQLTFSHPQSDVCSADYLDHKVLIPCKSSETVVNGKDDQSITLNLSSHSS